MEAHEAERDRARAAARLAREQAAVADGERAAFYHLAAAEVLDALAAEHEEAAAAIERAAHEAAAHAAAWRSA